jgi:cobalt-zinc-cadmium efflux system outer membrane protein
LTAEARLNFANARASLAAWQEAETAAVALEESARLSARAFELGEGELAPVLSTRRLAIDGRIAATSQRREAQYSRARLQLDAHRLWPLDAHPDEEDSHAHHY